jgi:GNAT superfamily N-acetyltransferase
MDLLAASWPRLRTAIPEAARLGARWDELSTAFVELEDGRAAAHAGVLWIPMVVDARRVDVAGIHAVCTAELLRGRGLARRVLERAIEWASQRTETIVLHANDAAIYGRFGFRALAQTVWWCDVAVPRVPEPRRMQRLSTSDVARVFAAFDGRVPVSERVGVGEAAALFVLDEILACDRFARLWALDDLVIACDLEDRVLQIYDVVGPRWPPLEEIVAAAPGRVDRVELFFMPDRWASRRWRTREMSPPDVLMVRGPFSADAEIAVPPLARC